jgi:thiamine kinase-like enzyme
VRRLRAFKTNVLLLDIGKELLVLKNFDRFKKLCFQKKLMQKLNEIGFTQAFEFYDKCPPFNYEGKEFFLLKYIFPSKDFFSFQTFSNREQGLKLLSHLHKNTSRILQEYPKDFKFKQFDQIEKWEERLLEFEQNLYRIQSYTSIETLQIFLEMGKISLEGMIKTNNLDKGKLAIIHGDVAHHNFIRSLSGKLHLIDFDLLSIAPAMIDYLQYANRILPYCQFDGRKLMHHYLLFQQMEHPFFLHALIYPTDIFREWNRFIREQSFLDLHKIQTMKAITENDLEKRIEFSKQIKILLK